MANVAAAACLLSGRRGLTGGLAASVGGSLLELTAGVGGSLLEPMQPHFEKLEEQCMNNFRLTVQSKLSSVTVTSLEDQ